MDFTFTDEQTMLRESLVRYLQRHATFAGRQELLRGDRPYSTETWQHFAELGLLALPFAEDVGGAGGSVVDLVAIGEPFGEHLLVEPYLPRSCWPAGPWRPPRAPGRPAVVDDDHGR